MVGKKYGIMTTKNANAAAMMIAAKVQCDFAFNHRTKFYLCGTKKEQGGCWAEGTSCPPQVVNGAFSIESRPKNCKIATIAKRDRTVY